MLLSTWEGVQIQTNPEHKGELTRFSNGIRFSISDLSPLTARILPTIYHHRFNLSLYDAQYQGQEKIPIPQGVIENILDALRQFKETCQDFDVPHDQIRIVATEATRTAINYADFLDQIYSKLGFKVVMLAKEEEGSFDRTKGLVMDLGGGSVQLTWMESDGGLVKIGKKGSVSLPYGAAALTKKLESIESREQHEELEHKLTREISKAFRDLEILELLREHSESQSGLHIFLSGGGFRGWGFVLMSKHAVQPYPIPIINGFSVDDQYFGTSNLSGFSNIDSSTFRISSRRSSQIPAISLLVNAFTRALPSSIYKYKVHFAQGGVREGLLYSTLPSSIQSSNPLVAATSLYTPRDASALLTLVQGALPRHAPGTFLFTEPLLLSAVNFLHAHASVPKEIRASSALRCTTTGLIANAHGISHEERGLLALILCERWRVELAPTDYEFESGLKRLVGTEATFWAMYIGRILSGLGNMFPAGVVRNGVLQMESTWEITEGDKKPREPLLKVKIHCTEQKIKIAEDWAKDIEKLGKKKNWVHSGESGVSGGFKIHCTLGMELAND
ncbi:MAG: hypothetical protein Q9195_000089 [Heterodermia aff. obscurata]